MREHKVSLQPFSILGSVPLTQSAWLTWRHVFTQCMQQNCWSGYKNLNYSLFRCAQKDALGLSCQWWKCSQRSMNCSIMADLTWSQSVVNVMCTTVPFIPLQNEPCPSTQTEDQTHLSSWCIKCIKMRQCPQPIKNQVCLKTEMLQSSENAELDLYSIFWYMKYTWTVWKTPSSVHIQVETQWKV